MDLKKWLIALAVAVLSAALVGSPTTAIAASGEMSNAGLIRHSPADDGDESGETEADNSGDHGNPEDASNPDHHGDPGDDAEDPRDNGSCTSVSSVAVCVDQPRN